MEGNIFNQEGLLIRINYIWRNDEKVSSMLLTICSAFSVNCDKIFIGGIHFLEFISSTYNSTGAAEVVVRVGELMRVNLDPVVEQVKAALQNFPRVAGAYLFGSILGPCRPDSDIDLGLILEPGIDPDSIEADRLESAISLLLPPHEGHSYDIVLLNPDKPLFAFRVLLEGGLITRDRLTVYVLTKGSTSKSRVMTRVSGIDVKVQLILQPRLKLKFETLAHQIFPIKLKTQ